MTEPRVRKNVICVADDTGQTPDNKTFVNPNELRNWAFLEDRDDWIFVNRVIVSTSDDGDKDAIEKSDSITFKKCADWLMENAVGYWTSVNIDIIGEGLTHEERQPEMAVLWYCSEEADAVGLKLYMENEELVYPDEDITDVRA